jgi:hypothetical protein
LRLRRRLRTSWDGKTAWLTSLRASATVFMR